MKVENLKKQLSRLKEPSLTQNAKIVLEKRYLKKDISGKVIETPSEMFARVAINIAEAELKYTKSTKAVRKLAEQFYLALANLEFLPNSPTLMNAGNVLQQLSACFVLPVGDSIESIFETIKHTALIHKSGGGDWFFILKASTKK